MTLATKIYAGIQAVLTGVADLGTPVFRMEDEPALVHTLPSGTTAGKADRLFADKRTLAASANETLDLAGGGLVDPLGTAVTFVKVKAILIKAAATNTNTVVVGGAAANAFVGPFGAAAHKVVLQPGSEFLITAPKDGWPVAAGTGDLLKLENGGAGSVVDYSIVLVGTSA